MKTSTALLIAGGIIVGALVWKRVGTAKNQALSQAGATTATVNKLADAVNHANQTIAPVTGQLSEALNYTKNLFGAIGSSNQQKSYSGPGGGQFI